MENTKLRQEKELGAWWLVPCFIGGAICWWYIGSAIWNVVVN